MKVGDIKNKALLWKIIQKCSSLYFYYYKLPSKDIPDYETIRKCYFHYPSDAKVAVMSFAIHINHGGNLFAVSVPRLMRELNRWFNCGYDVGRDHIVAEDATELHTELNKLFQSGLDFDDIITYYEE